MSVPHFCEGDMVSYKKNKETWQEPLNLSLESVWSLNLQYRFTTDLARLLRRAYSRPVWIIFFEFVKVCGIRFSIWESFIGFYICCYPISTILACLFSVGVRISWKKLCWMRACRRKWHLVFPTLYIIIVDRVNLNKLLQIIMKLRWSNKDNNN